MSLQALASLEARVCRQRTADDHEPSGVSDYLHEAEQTGRPWGDESDYLHEAAGRRGRPWKTVEDHGQDEPDPLHEAGQARTMDTKLLGIN
jgi:hypothetical protein